LNIPMIRFDAVCWDNVAGKSNIGSKEFAFVEVKNYAGFIKGIKNLLDIVDILL